MVQSQYAILVNTQKNNFWRKIAEQIEIMFQCRAKQPVWYANVFKRSANYHFCSICVFIFILVYFTRADGFKVGIKMSPLWTYLTVDDSSRKLQQLT